MYVHGIRALFRFEGYVVQNTAMSSEMVQVTLRRDGRRASRCPACGGRAGATRRAARDEARRRPGRGMEPTAGG